MVVYIALVMMISSIVSVVYTDSYFNVWSGEHLDDLIMKTDGSGITDKHGLLVIYDSSCSIKMNELGLVSLALPPTRTLVYLHHDYRTAQEHTWFKDNGDDLRLRFNVVNCPEVLFIPRGSTKNDPAVTWQRNVGTHLTTLLTWVWDQLKVKVTIYNSKDISVKILVDHLGPVGPDQEAYPQFIMLPEENKDISIYESSLVMAYSDPNEIFIGAWEITGPLVINVINSHGDTQSDDIVVLDILKRFNKEETRVKEWLQTNSDRYMLILKQPLFVPKLTEHGYHLSKIPDEWYKVLRQFYDAHKPLSREEKSPFTDSVINYDEVTNDMIELTIDVKAYVADGLRAVMEDWCDCKLEITSMYGVRVYHNGSILRNHVDRIETHVISAILQIDQQVRTPWLLEVIDYQGDRHHIELSPGEMLMYESAKLIHGRPQPLNGDLYANVFLHYRPQSGWDDYRREGGLLLQGDRIESLMRLDSPLTQDNAHERKLRHANKNVKDEL